MDKIEKLINHKSYIDALNKIIVCEMNREFCKHNMEHFLDVARIAYIINLEKNLQISKEMIYTAALLHDIGRGAQYSEGIPHNEASVNISREVLDDLGFTDIEKAQIINAIYHHGNHDKHDRHGNHDIHVKEMDQTIDDNLCYLINHADKLSRTCFSCSASEQCYWDFSKKNKTVIY